MCYLQCTRNHFYRKDSTLLTTKLLVTAIEKRWRTDIHKSSLRQQLANAMLTNLYLRSRSQKNSAILVWNFPFSYQNTLILILKFNSTTKLNLLYQLLLNQKETALRWKHYIQNSCEGTYRQKTFMRGLHRPDRLCFICELWDSVQHNWIQVSTQTHTVAEIFWHAKSIPNNTSILPL